MNRTTMVMATGLLLLTGCPDHEPQGLLATIAVARTEDCTAQPAVGGTALAQSNGILDLTIARQGYYTAINLVNLLPNSDAVTTLGEAEARQENNWIQILGATVSYDYNLPGLTLPQGFFQPGPTGIAPASAAIGAVNVFPPQVIKILRANEFFTSSKAMKDPLIRRCYESEDLTPDWQSAPIGGHQLEITVKMTFLGVLQDGSEVRSNEFRFPVEICSGCLLQPQVPTSVIGEILGTGLEWTSTCTETVCTLGQDRCVDILGCFYENFLVEEAADAVLQACAQKTGLFDDIPCSTSVPPFMGCLTPGAGSGETLNYLRYAYAFDRTDAYCYFGDESPLYPPQIPVAVE